MHDLIKFNSNVVGTKFGRGSELQREWECICGHVNKKYFVQCGMCSLAKGVALDAKKLQEAKNGPR